MINLPAHPPSWLLVEWQEDLESAAVDLGQAFAVDDEGDSKATFVAQENFARASQRVAWALEMLAA
jgi:hypothetical protein